MIVFMRIVLLTFFVSILYIEFRFIIIFVFGGVVFISILLEKVLIVIFIVLIVVIVI